MMIPLVGGPYDGHRIWASHVQQHMKVLVLDLGGMTRRFIRLPGPVDCRAVLDGRIRLDQLQRYCHYEMVSTRDGLSLRFDAHREAHRAAIEEAIRELPDRGAGSRDGSVVGLGVPGEE